MRLTRSQMREQAAQGNPADLDIAIDATATGTVDFGSDDDRNALKEIAANQTEAPDLATEEKPTKKKGGKKGGKKGKKNDKVEEVNEEPEEFQEQQKVLEDEQVASGSDASEEAVKELQGEESTTQQPMEDQIPAPQSRATRTTRRQLAKQQEELSKSQSEHARVEAEEVATPAVETATEVTTIPEEPEFDVDEQTDVVVTQEPEAPLDTVPEVEAEELTGANAEILQEEETTQVMPEATEDADTGSVDIVRPKADAIEGQEDGEEIALEASGPAQSLETAEHVESLPASEHVASPVEDSVPNETPEASEPVQEDVVQSVEEPQHEVVQSPLETETTEQASTPKKAKSSVNKEASHFDNTNGSHTPVGSPAQRASSIEALDAMEDAMDEMRQSLSASASKARRTSAVRFDLPEEGKASKPAPKPANGVKPAMKKPTAPAPAPKAGIKRSASVKAPPTTETARQAKQEVNNYLASKRRPVSVSFPTPPPPARSTKAPTKSTFTLPGEAVAAKLKAQKEERLKREAEEANKKPAPFKARPVPKHSAPVSVKQNKASQARESMMGGEKPLENKNPGRVSSISTTNGHRTTSSTSSKPLTLQQRAPSASSTSRPSSSDHSSKPSMSFSTNTSMHKHRQPSNPGPVQKSIVSATEAAAQRQRAKSIFNRDKQEKEAKEKEKKDKEEAAKRARLEASERSRAISREWKDKQAAKKKAAVSAANGA